MKTAISLPDALYLDAEKTAKSLGIPRSQLFALALEEFISHHNKQHITDQLNKIYKNIGVQDSPTLVDSNLDSFRELTQNDAW
jgi:metal-responsive CopG/Arc/MetJ family transcriptional regulator